VGPPAVSRDSVVRTYRRYAPVYDRLFGLVLDQGRRRLAECVAQRDVGSVLEVGVGTGLTLGRYPAATHVTGIDLSEDMLARARRRAARLPGHRIELRRMDAERTDFADDSFDCVTLPYVLSVTPNPATLIAEVRRVCRPGGTIVILNHFSGDPRWRWMERAVRSVAANVGFHSEFDFAQHVGSHDWTLETVQPVNLFRLSKLVVIRND
jgi:phosphatidylethanolamine/phosphatidyl-N-methylethanolamine N-methyltransferase